MKKIRMILMAGVCAMGAFYSASAAAAPNEEQLYGPADMSSDTPYANGSYSSGNPGNARRSPNNTQSMAERISWDTQDPLWLGGQWDILSKTYANYGNDVLRIGEALSVGLNERLTIFGNIQYQADFNGPADGFSGPEIGGIYRFSERGVLSDLYAGIKLGGQVRVPSFATDIYYVGARVGKQWSWVTLAADLQTSWIFDETRGMATIDLTPTAYFRLPWDWSAGVSLDLRKSTNPIFDEQILGGQLAKRYGRTMYVGLVSYAIENPEWRFGLQLNILF